MHPMIHKSYCFLALVLVGFGGCNGTDEETPNSDQTLVRSAFTEIIEEHLVPIEGDAYGFDASESLFQHFERLGEINFSDSVLIGTIGRLEIAGNDRFVIVDRQSQEVHIVHASGRHLGMLRGTDCDPGINWQPFDATVLEGGDILVVNSSARSLVRFNSDLTCQGFINPEEWWTGEVIGAGPDHLYTFERGREGYGFVLRTGDGTEIKRFGESNRFVNFLWRMGGFNQMIIGPDGALIAGLPPHAAPIIFDSLDAEGRPLFEPPDYVRPMTDDMPASTSGDPSSIIEAMQEVTGDRTTLQGIYRLSSSSTLVRYRNNYREITDVDAYGLHVVHDDGRVLTPEPVFYSRGHAPNYSGFSPLAIKDNLLFSQRPARQEPDGDWGNPGLVVWRFTPM